nr:hypothetical protein GCM10020093_027340 [Planobispora longispora]
MFDNGMRLSSTDWIAEGTLARLLQTRHSAELTAMPVTPAIDNLILEGPDGGRSLEEMIASTERGLLLTCLWYIREVDPQTLLLTGLTRDGVYLVENGEVVGEVNNFRFNESPVDLLGRIAEVGASEQTLPASGTTTSPARSCPPCGCRTSTCRRSARRADGAGGRPGGLTTGRRGVADVPAARRTGTARAGKARAVRMRGAFAFGYLIVTSPGLTGPGTERNITAKCLWSGLRPLAGQRPEVTAWPRTDGMSTEPTTSGCPPTIWPDGNSSGARPDGCCWPASASPTSSPATSRAGTSASPRAAGAACSSPRS